MCASEPNPTQTYPTPASKLLLHAVEPSLSVTQVRERSLNQLIGFSVGTVMHPRHVGHGGSSCVRLLLRCQDTTVSLGHGSRGTCR
jgi:hypothetical protein